MAVVDLDMDDKIDIRELVEYAKKTFLPFGEDIVQEMFREAT